MENEVLKRGGTSEGSCSSWGYYIQLIFFENNCQVEFKFIKQEKKFAEVYIDQEGQYVSFTEITIRNIHFNESFIFQNNWIKRLFMRNDFKKQFEYPIYFSSTLQNIPTLEMKFFDIIERYSCTDFILKNGKLLVKIKRQGEDSFKLVDEFIRLM